MKNSNETPQAKNLKEENEILKAQVKLLKQEKEELLVVNVSLAEKN
jgi:cell division protein FtsB